MELFSRSCHELAEELASGRTSSEKILASVSARAQAVEGRVRAFARFPGSLTCLEARGSCGQGSALAGIPVAVKDNICTNGVATECCSRILEGFKPPYDATVITRLKQAGACILSVKTNMDEFAFGSSTENSCFGATCNPWDISRVAGGSSGGSAACVAADETILAIGSDTGGSIRQPAAFCGVVGMKPTYGRVSRYGLIAFASSLDQIGPLAKDMHDCAILLTALCGQDPLDATSAAVPVPDFTRSLGMPVKGLRIGIPAQYFVEGMDPEVGAAVREATKVLEKLGARLVDVSLPHTEYATSVYYVIATAEASSNLARFDGVQYGLRVKQPKMIEMDSATRQEGFGLEAKRRILLGTFALSHGYYDAYYVRALKVRHLIKRDFDAVFKECDCIVTPTSPTPAFKVGERSDDPLQMYLSDVFTISANLAGIPAVSLPCGFTRAGLPVGLQVMARHFDEEMLIRVGHAYEQKAGWLSRRPSL